MIGNESSSDLAQSFRFAPHLGIWEPGPGLFHHSAGMDPVAQIQFAIDHGFKVVQDNFIQKRGAAEQERIAAALNARNMMMGSFVATTTFEVPTFALSDRDAVAFLVREIEVAIGVAKRMNAVWLTVIPGKRAADLPLETQLEALTSNLKRCAERAEAAGVILLVESMNRRDRPDMLLHEITQAAEIIRAVGSRSCKLMFDAYHVHVESSDLIGNIDRCWQEIGYFQIADDPGRCEPGTGQIDFARMVAHIHRKGYRGPVDMEHKVSGDGVEGETAVLQAYVALRRSCASIIELATRVEAKHAGP